jgi:hypothetical protein
MLSIKSSHAMAHSEGLPKDLQFNVKESALMIRNEKMKAPEVK